MCEAAAPSNWHSMKAELELSGVGASGRGAATATAVLGVPAGALSPPATLSPPSSPTVHPHCPWSPSTGNGTALGHHHQQQSLSAFSLVSGYAAGELQGLPGRDMRCNLMYGGYESVAAAWWAHHAVAAGLLLPHSGFPHQGQTKLEGAGSAGPPSPAMGCSSPPRRCSPEKAKFLDDAPLNLSTKPSDLSSRASVCSSASVASSISGGQGGLGIGGPVTPGSLGRKSEIWSPGSVCEREARETSTTSSLAARGSSSSPLGARSPGSSPLASRQIRHSPLTPPSTERTFQVMQAVRQGVQEVEHPQHPPAHPLGHETLSLPVLRQEVPPKVRHEEAHLHTHRREAAQVRRLRQGLLPEQQPDNAHAQAHRLQALPVRPLRQGVPAEGRPEEAPRGPAPDRPGPRLPLAQAAAYGRRRGRLRASGGLPRLHGHLQPGRQLRRPPQPSRPGRQVFPPILKASVV